MRGSVRIGAPGVFRGPGSAEQSMQDRDCRCNQFINEVTKMYTRHPYKSDAPGSILMGVKDTDTDTELEIYHVNILRSHGMPNWATCTKI